MSGDSTPWKSKIFKRLKHIFMPIFWIRMLILKSVYFLDVWETAIFEMKTRTMELGWCRDNSCVFWLSSSVLSPGSFRVDRAELIFGQMLFFQIQKYFKSKKFSNLKRFQIRKVFKSKKISNPRQLHFHIYHHFQFPLYFHHLIFKANKKNFQGCDQW